jgi:MFS transporter, SP family, arabinose:H+ symporter
MTMTTSRPSSIRFVLFATAVTAIGGFLFGYDTAVVNGAISYLRLNMHLNSAQEGMAGSSAILGCIPGAMCAGVLSDRFGRKKMLLFCAVLYAVSGVLSALPRTFEWFLLARFLSGVGIGASSMICPTYIAEIAPEKMRGRLGSLFQVAIVSGVFITLFVNREVHKMGNDDWNTAMGWRWMVGLEAVPAIIFFFLLFTVPESPRWLALHSKEDEARDIFERVSGSERADQELVAIRTAMKEESGQFSELFTSHFWRPTMIAVVLMACSQFCGVNAIIYYSTSIFAKADASSTKDAAFTASAWVGLVNVLFTFVAVALVDRAGRRPLLLAGCAVQTVALATVGWMFHQGQSGIGLLLAIMAFIGAFAVGIGPVGWLLTAEIFPNKIRARAMSLTSFTVWVCCNIVALTFPMLRDSPWVGPAKTFAVYSAVSLFAFVFILLAIPETKGQSLEEIEQMWLGKARRVAGDAE